MATLNVFDQIETCVVDGRDGDSAWLNSRLLMRADTNIEAFTETNVETLIEYTGTDLSDDRAQIGSSHDCAKIGSSDNLAQIATTSYNAKIGSSGDYTQIASGGNCAQIAGATSGYARKYALCVLFAINDNKDAEEYAEQLHAMIKAG